MLRAEYDYQNHRTCQRKIMLHRFQMLTETVQTYYDTQIYWIIDSYDKDEKKLKELETRAYDLSMDLKNNSTAISTLDPKSNDKHTELLIQFKKIKAKQRHNDFLCDLHKNLLYLLSKHRHHISRLATKSKTLSEYTNEYFIKVGKDWNTLTTVLGWIEERLHLFSDSKDNNFFCYEWLSGQNMKIRTLLANYDTDQERTLEREKKRLEKEIHLITLGDNAITEIYKLIHAEISYESENAGSELAYITVIEGSEKGLEISERMESICEKIKILRGSIYPECESAIDFVHGAMEKDMEKSPVDIIGDCDITKLDHHHKMSGHIRHIQKKHQAMKTKDWLVMFWSQPWLRLQHLHISRRKAYIERERKDVDSKMQFIEKCRKKLEDDKEERCRAKFAREQSAQSPNIDVT